MGVKFQVCLSLRCKDVFFVGTFCLQQFNFSQNFPNSIIKTGALSFNMMTMMTMMTIVIMDDDDYIRIGAPQTPGSKTPYFHSKDILSISQTSPRTESKETISEVDPALAICCRCFKFRLFAFLTQSGSVLSSAQS